MMMMILTAMAGVAMLMTRNRVMMRVFEVLVRTFE